MKTILFALLCLVFSNAQAVVDHYVWGGIAFPDETTNQGLPEAIPCITKKAYNGAPMLKCTWLENGRQIAVWDERRRQDVHYPNRVSGACIRGTCRADNHIAGEWPQDVMFITSIWYRVGISSDGKPVAYRNDVSRQVSYAEAGSLLYQFYLDIGVPDDQLVSTFDGRYEGGYAAWQAEKGGAVKAAVQTEWPDVKSAWCNPRMDDECYINEKRVPMAELTKWLPPYSQSNVDQLGGYCEAILCYDKDDVPLGVLLQ